MLLEIVKEKWFIDNCNSNSKERSNLIIVAEYHPRCLIEKQRKIKFDNFCRVSSKMAGVASGLSRLFKAGGLEVK